MFSNITLLCHLLCLLLLIWTIIYLGKTWTKGKYQRAESLQELVFLLLFSSNLPNHNVSVESVFLIFFEALCLVLSKSCSSDLQMSAGGLKPERQGHPDLCWGSWPVGAVSGQRVWEWKTLICYWKGTESRTLRGSNIRLWRSTANSEPFCGLTSKSQRQKYTNLFFFLTRLISKLFKAPESL